MRFLIITVLFFLLACSPLFCQEEPGGSLYELQPGSTYQEGCVAPCKCAVRMYNLTGTFVLSKRAIQGGSAAFDLNCISWAAGSAAFRTVITGNGKYTISGEKHRLALDLSINGRQASFDTGFVPGGADFPRLRINVDQGGKCRDRWIDIIAAPGK